MEKQEKPSVILVLLWWLVGAVIMVLGYNIHIRQDNYRALINVNFFQRINLMQSSEVAKYLVIFTIIILYGLFAIIFIGGMVDMAERIFWK